MGRWVGDELRLQKGDCLCHQVDSMDYDEISMAIDECEEKCPRYYHCNTIAYANDRLKEIEERRCKDLETSFAYFDTLDLLPHIKEMKDMNVHDMIGELKKMYRHKDKRSQIAFSVLENDFGEYVEDRYAEVKFDSYHWKFNIECSTAERNGR